MCTISIITVNYRQPEVTLQFLHSIKEHGKADDIEVVLVDNSPEQDNKNEYIAVFPQLKYIYSSENLGFAGGNNLGIQQARGKYILLLNNDTEITSGFLENMVKEMENNPDIGLLSPLILYYEDTSVIQYAGFTNMNYVTCRNKAIGYKEKNIGQYKTNYKTGYCHGAAVMCRKADLEEAGMMDENYFLYYEELDWCEKFKRIGKKIWFTGNAVIYHKESMSVGKESCIKTYFMTRNRMLFIRKNTGWVNTFLFTIYYIFFACSKQFFKYIIAKRKDLATCTIKGLLWNFIHNKHSKTLGYTI